MARLLKLLAVAGLITGACSYVPRLVDHVSEARAYRECVADLIRDC